MGEIGRTPIVAAAQDFSFMGGSMGMYVGNAIIAAAQRAVVLKRPLILFSAAGGARMQEGILSLMQMAKISAALARTLSGLSGSCSEARIASAMALSSPIETKRP